MAPLRRTRKNVKSIRPRLERLEQRNLLAAEVLPVTLDGIVSDTDDNGTFETVSTNDSSLRVRRFSLRQDGVHHNEASILEFDLGRIEGWQNATSVDLSFYMNSFTSSSSQIGDPRLRVEAIPGDSRIDSSDGSTIGTLVGTLNRSNFSLGVHTISLDVAVLEQATSDGKLAIRLAGDRLVNVSVAATELSRFYQSPELVLNLPESNQPPNAVDDSYSVGENGVLNVGGQSSSTIDQQSLGIDYKTTPNFSSIQQRVVAGRTGQLDSFDIRLVELSSVPGGQLGVGVYKGAPWQTSSLELVYSSSITTQPDDFDNWVTFDTSEANIQLTEGEEFTIAVSASGDLTYVSMSFVPLSNDSYPQGELWRQGTPLITSSGSGYDLAFRTRMAESTGPQGVLVNDTDPDGNASDLAVSLVDGTDHGELDLREDGSFTYTPAADFWGSDEFTYRVTDAGGATDTAVARITVQSSNTAPRPVNATVRGPEDVDIDGQMSAVDLDNDRLSYEVQSEPSSGQLEWKPDGSFTYKPGLNFSGEDHFTFTASDAESESSLARISIVIDPVNDAPVASDLIVALDENSEAGTAVGTVTANDVDNAELVFSIVGGDGEPYFDIESSTGRIIVADGQVIDYEAASKLILNVNVSDGTLSDEALVTININDLLDTVDIDVGDDSNTLSGKSVQVAILSTTRFDATTSVLPDQLRFGATGTEDSLKRHKKRGPKVNLIDVNGDGLVDLVATFELNKTGLTTESVDAVLTGTLADGSSFRFSDAVTVSGKGNNGRGRSK